MYRLQRKNLIHIPINDNKNGSTDQQHQMIIINTADFVNDACLCEEEEKREREREVYTVCVCERRCTQ